MMADSDDDTANEGGDGLDLTSFLFGNIDQSGNLEEEFLDASTKKQLNSLGNLLSGTNLNSLAREVSIEAQEEESDIVEETDFNQKAEDAEDFSNIDEMMDDDTSSEEDSDEDEDDTMPKDVDNDNAEPVVAPVLNGNRDDATVEKETPQKPEVAPPQPSTSAASAVAAPVSKESNSDSLLMPPPPGPIPTAAQEPRPSTSSGGSVVAPLAGMLPEKYRNVDVKTFTTLVLYV